VIDPLRPRRAPPLGSEPCIPFQPSARMPDPRIEVLHPRFAALRLFSASVEQLCTGLRWAEGPVWFGDGRFLLVSDIPSDRILRWDECSGLTSVFRAPSGHANGLARDRQGRLLTCEHGPRRVTRTEHDGSVTVLADQVEGRRLNSPNDIACSRDGAVWFTDPTFGIASHWEGSAATSETPPAVYRIDPVDGAVTRVLDDLVAPNGLAFSPDESVLYVVDSRSQPHRTVWAWDVAPGGRLANKRRILDASGPGAFDGIAVDAHGNLWCGLGADGSPGSDPEGLDGVRVFDPEGRPIGHIHLPERCANLCFGGRHRNRLFMAAGHSVYALHVAVQGA
jgi:gluconolactonase